MSQSEKFPFHPNRFPFFYGWIVIFVGTLGLVMTIPGQTIGLSTFTDSLIESLGISRDQLSLAYMFGTVSSSLMLTRAGRLFDRFGPRPLAITASICLGLGLLYMSATDSISQYVQEVTGCSKLWAVFPVIFLGFLLIRFFGQGVLNLASKTMMMKWFDERRGFAMGFSSVAVSGGFSIAPAIIDGLIVDYSYKGAWMMMAFVLILIFPIIIFIFYRNDPKDVGLEPDGNWSGKLKDKPQRFPVKKDFQLKEAKGTLAFWIFAGFLAMQGLYITGFTFHITSIFEEVDMTREQSTAIFQYIAIVAVSMTLVFSTLSDYIKMKYLLFVMMLGVVLSLVGTMGLGEAPFYYYFIIVGIGIASGMFGVISAVCWPRFFGKKHLGEIMGMMMTVLVFASALGPILLSQSLSHFGTYNVALTFILGMFSLLFLGAVFVRNPQEEFDTQK